MDTKIRLGVIQRLLNVEEEIRKVAELGLPTCQINCWDPTLYNDESASALKRACAENEVEVTSLWAGYSGPVVWNFLQGPSTIGLVPPETRKQRTEELKMAADFAAKTGIPSITTHAGFIPENPNDPLYAGTVKALREVAEHAKFLGLMFCFETGQETPITLMRVIKDVGTGNLGINLDPANLLMYGKANPVDAVDIFANLIKGIHAKDGEYPVEPSELGVEKPLGEGRVNFPLLISKLKQIGYDGAITIEREISGPQQIADIKRAMAILESLL